MSDAKVTNVWPNSLCKVINEVQVVFKTWPKLYPNKQLFSSRKTSKEVGKYLELQWKR